MPVLLGIPALVTAITGFFTNAVTLFLGWLAQRSVLNVFALTAMVATLTGMLFLIDSLVDQVLQALVGLDLQWFAFGILPDATPWMVSTALAAEGARYVHDWTQAAISKKFR